MEIKRVGGGEVVKRNCLGEVEYLTFPAIEDTGIVRHLFSTRVGGVSEGMFASMNLSYTRGDEKDAVDENFARVARILGRRAEDFVFSDQTHTTNIRRVTAKDRGKGLVREKDYADVDGLITDEPGIVLSTFYADCVPLFFVDTVHRAIGLSHSGWKGTVNRMGERTLEAMKREFETESKDVTAAIGPSICGKCYEVDGDVAEQFAAVFEGEALTDILVKKENGKYLLDLWKANFYVLTQAGVPKEKISVTDICTCCNPDYLFSHRASKGKRGNLGAFLSLYPT
jgi:YfiH family protein